MAAILVLLFAKTISFDLIAQIVQIKRKRCSVCFKQKRPKLNHKRSIVVDRH